MVARLLVLGEHDPVLESPSTSEEAGGVGSHHGIRDRSEVLLRLVASVCVKSKTKTQTSENCRALPLVFLATTVPRNSTCIAML